MNPKRLHPTDTPQTQGIRRYHKRRSQIVSNWQAAVDEIDRRLTNAALNAEGYNYALRDIRSILTRDLPEAK